MKLEFDGKLVDGRNYVSFNGAVWRCDEIAAVREGHLVAKMSQEINGETQHGVFDARSGDLLDMPGVALSPGEQVLFQIGGQHPSGTPGRIEVDGVALTEETLLAYSLRRSADRGIAPSHSFVKLCARRDIPIELRYSWAYIAWYIYSGKPESEREEWLANIDSFLREQLRQVRCAATSADKKIAAPKPAVPELYAEIQRQQQEALREHLPSAVSVLAKLMNDPKATAGAKVQASRLLNQHVFDNTPGKLPGEMTAEEIAADIEKMKAAHATLTGYADQSKQEAGWKYDAGKARLDLIAPEFLTGTAEILDFGAKKYGERNWEAGMSWSRPFAALMRHMWAWWAGQEHDEETGKSHLWHAACCLMFLIAFEARQVGKDDRAKISD